MDRLLAKSARHPWTHCFWRGVERITLPGIILHYWRRKRWIEGRCRTAIADGCGRIVILGAGFDTLGMRLSREFASLEVIELDHPATQTAKQRALSLHKVALPENLRFAPLNMAKEKFPAHLFDEASTVFILEGVLMYLPEPAVCELFNAMAKLLGGNVTVIFSFMTKWPDGRSGFRPHSRLIDCWLAMRAWRALHLVHRAGPHRGLLGRARFPTDRNVTRNRSER
jgi:methyltransferase (TIGR00027 family)